jgi:hypothetical protein
VQLAGRPSTLRALLRRGGAPTDGIVETVADLTLSAEDGTIGRIHLDMTATDPVRTWSVRGTRGSLHADLVAGRITSERPGRSHDLVHESAGGERDRAELAMIRHLFQVVAGSAAPACSGHDAIVALGLVEAARASHAAGGAEVALGGSESPAAEAR